MTLQEQSTTPQLVPLNTPTPLGPWTITVLEAISGDEAIAMLNEKNPENPDVSELPGADPETSYVLARISVQNTSSVPRVINLADFAATGTDGILRRPPAIEVPDPALQAIVPAGETLEGIVPFLVNDAESATVWFDSVLLGGNWARGVFALGGSAAIPTFEVGDSEPDDTGDSPENAVDLGTPVRVGGWEVTVTEWFDGPTVAAEADYRTNALGEAFIGYWFGLYATVKNLGTAPAVFPNDAFLVADESGEAWDNILALTPPEPDVSRELLPGATREGWAAFDTSAYEPNVPPIAYVRIQPNALSDSPRYVIIGATDSGGGEESPEPEEGGSAGSEPLDVATGETVVTFDEIVNLRDEASTGGEVVKELPVGTELEITGDPVEADGYRWYPVREIDGDLEGYVVQDYIEPAP